MKIFKKVKSQLNVKFVNELVGAYLLIEIVILTCLSLMAIHLLPIFSAQFSHSSSKRRGFAELLIILRLKTSLLKETFIFRDYMRKYSLLS